jgi:hypothetical protein
MLTDEDRKKMAFLAHVVEQGKDISRDEVRWLLDRLRMNLSHPEEFDFPDYVGLLDRVKNIAFGVRRFLKPDWKDSCDIPENGLTVGTETFFLRAACGQNNAFMVVRPWVRVHANTSDELFEKLRRCTIQCKFDDDPLVDNAPIDDYLIAKDGGGVRGWSPIINAMGYKHVYEAVALDTKEMNADPSKRMGIFVQNKTIVRLEIKGPSDLRHPPFQVISGFTAMEYTTEPEVKSETYAPVGAISRD